MTQHRERPQGLISLGQGWLAGKLHAAENHAKRQQHEDFNLWAKLRRAEIADPGLSLSQLCKALDEVDPLDDGPRTYRTVLPDGGWRSVK